MAVLSFKVQADYDKVVRLREEISKLEAQLKSFGKNTPLVEIKAVETRLAEAKTEFTALASEAAKTGAVLGNDFKSKIRESTTVVNDLTAKIIDQKAVIKDIEFDVKKLSEAYREAFKSGNSVKASETKAELDAAKRALEEEKAAMFELNQEKAKASLVTKKLKEDYKEFKEQAEETKEESEGFTMSLGKVAGLVGGVTALKQLGSAIVQVRAQFQDMETQIETLVGKDVTGKLLPQIRELAKVSPLTMGDIVGAEKMMLSFNIEAEKSVQFLKALSDVSMGNSQKFNSLTLAFSQMSSAGRLMGQDLLQMINAGFNPLQQISEKTGKSISQLKEEMSKGAISAEMVQQAFLDATAAGGKFYNMSENASKTINGQISMMQDAMDSVLDEIGTKSEKAIIKGIQLATSLVQNYEKVGKVLASLVATYGVYRTAVFLATTATGKLTIAEIALTKARTLATAAQKALNAAMLTNPYVALATVVAGLAAAMWTLRDNTSAAERAQENFNTIKDNATRKEKEHKNAIQGLIDIVRDDTNAIAARESAMIALRNEYPNLFSQYDIETLKLGNILDINKQLNEEMDKRKRAQSFVDIERQKAVITQLEQLGVTDKRIDAERETLRKLQQDYLMAYSLPDYVASLKGKSIDDLQQELGGAQHMASGAGIGIYEGMQADKQFYEGMVKAIEAEISSRNALQKNFAEDFEEKKKKYEEELEKFKWAEENKTKITTEEYLNRKAAKEAAEKEYKKLGGDPKEKEEKDEVKAANEKLAQQKRIDALTKKSSMDSARTAKDMQFMVEQARIDAMREGADKIRAQRKLDNERELEDLERQKQDYIDKMVENEKAIFDAQEDQKAKANAKYVKRTFDEEAARANVDTTAYDRAYDYTVQKQARQQDEFLKSLLSQYKSYEDQKMQVTIDYLNESDELQAMYEETGDERYKRSLEERHKAYVEALEKLERETGKGDYALIFRNPAEMTKETLTAALDAAEKKMQELIEKGAEPDMIDPLYDRIKAIREEIDNYQVSGVVTDLMALVKQAKVLQEARKRLDTLDPNSELYKKEAEAIKRGEQNLKKSIAATGVAEFSDLLVKAADAMHQIAAESGDIDLADTAKALQTAGGILNSVTQGFMQGGPIGLLVGLITSAVSAIASLALEAELADAKMANSMAAFRRELKLTELAIAEANFQSIFGLQEFELAQDAILKYKEAIALFVEQSDKLKEMSWKYGTGISWFPEEGVLFETYDKMASLIKQDIWDENGLLDVEKAKDFLATNETLTDEVREQVEYAIELKEAYDEAVQILDDFVSSFVGTAASDLTDAIFEAVDNGGDAWDLFEEKGSETIRNLGKQMVKELIQRDLANTWTDKLRNAAGDPEALAATYSEMMDWLKSQSEAYVAAAKQWEEQYGSAQEVLTEQSASAKGYQTLSEDTGTELAGRALAQYESNLRMEEATRSMKDSVEQMVVSNTQIRDIAAEARTLIAHSYLELQQIRENTGISAQVLRTINIRMGSWDNVIKSL